MTTRKVEKEEPTQAERLAERGIVWRGPPELEPMLVPLGAISLHPDNPKLHDLGAIASSLARFGQTTSIVVQKATGWAIAGNGRREAMPMVGEVESVLGYGPGDDWTHIAVVQLDISDLEAKALAIADNRTHDLGGGYDDEKLSAVLSELANADELAAIGYDGSDVDALLASLEAYVPEDDGDQAEPTLGSEVVVTVRCSKDYLEKIAPVLAEWRLDDGVEVEVA